MITVNTIICEHCNGYGKKNHEYGYRGDYYLKYDCEFCEGTGRMIKHQLTITSPFKENDDHYNYIIKDLEKINKNNQYMYWVTRKENIEKAAIENNVDLEKVFK